MTEEPVYKYTTALCSKCGKVTPQKSLPLTQCPNCGEAEPMWMAICPHCGKGIYKDFLPLSKCPHCDQPALFLAYCPFDRQQIAHQSEAEYVLYGGAMGGGKSVFLVNDCLLDCLRYPGVRNGIYRWERQSFMATTYETLREWVLDVPGLVVHHDRSQQVITLLNDSQIVYGGLKSSQSVAGEDPRARLKSLEHHNIYVDEVTEIPKDWFDILRTRKSRCTMVDRESGRKLTPKGQIKCTANPEVGWVKEEWIDTKNNPNHAFVQSKCADNLYLHPEYEQGLRDSLPAEMILRYVDGDWESVSTFDSINPIVWVEAAARRQNIKPGVPVIMGVDVASSGEDATVIMKRDGMVGKLLDSVHVHDTMEVAGLVAMHADREGPTEIRIDAIGVGAGVADRLDEMGYPVVRIISGERSNDPHKFFNLRAEMWWEFRTLLERGTIAIPDDTGLKNDLTAPRYILTDKVIQVEKKDLIKKRLGHSPDKGDACIYTFFGAAEMWMVAGVVGGGS